MKFVLCEEQEGFKAEYSNTYRRFDETIGNEGCNRNGSGDEENRQDYIVSANGQHFDVGLPV